MVELKPYEEMIPVKHFICLKCDYAWIPRRYRYGDDLPVVCPNCNSASWKEPYKPYHGNVVRGHVPGDTLTVDQWEIIIDNQKNQCAICGEKFSSVLVPTKDHIIPITKGGSLTFDNTQALCIYCNCKKGKKLYSGLRNSWRGKGACVDIPTLP